MWILSPYLRVYNFPHSSHKYPLLTFLEFRSLIISSLHPDVLGLSGSSWPPFKFVPSGFGVADDEGNLVRFCSAPNIIGPEGFITGWPFSDGNPWGKPYLNKGIPDGLQRGGLDWSKNAGLLNISGIWFCENAGESCDKLYRIPLSPFSSFKSGLEIDGNSVDTGTGPSSGLLKPLKFAGLKGCDWLTWGTRGECLSPSFIPNVSAVKDGKLTGVSGVSIGCSLSGDFMTCKSEPECNEKPVGEPLEEEVSPPELCNDLGLSFIRNESVLKLEKKGNWFMASDRLLKPLNPFTPFKHPMLVDKFNPVEGWPPPLPLAVPLTMCLSSCKVDTSDKKALPVWWWILLVSAPSCFRLIGAGSPSFATCIPSASEFGARNKVLILGGLFNGLFLLGRLLVYKCVRWLWHRVSL